MKLLITICISILCSLTPQTSVKEDIQTAISSGNSNALGKYFDQQIELKILEKEAVYSKSQAMLVVKDFFTNHVVDSFLIKHVIDKKNDTEFMIGHLNSSDQDYRVYILVKNKKLIQQLRIEKED